VPWKNIRWLFTWRERDRCYKREDARTHTLSAVEIVYYPEVYKKMGENTKFMQLVNKSLEHAQTCSGNRGELLAQ